MIHKHKLGIMGGGQLGRMLLQSAIDLNLYTLVLDPDPMAPCRDLCNEFELGSYADYDTVYQFGKRCTVVTIEIEHVNCDALEQLQKEGIEVHPSPQVIRLVQDKGLQKQFYKDNGIPTAPFYLAQSRADLQQMDDIFPAFQKLRTSGYDGKGVVRLNSANDLIDEAFDAPSVVEQLVPYEKEIAVLCARNKLGDIELYDPIEMDFHPEHNLVEYLFAPAKIEAEVWEKAVNIATEIVEKLKVVGLLAVELFVTREGEVLVNEVAPRPHNSGHHTMRAALTSQFEQHLRAILHLPLGSSETVSPSVLVNLLGEAGCAGEARYDGLEEVLQVPGAYVHLYGKAVTKPFRKMGHVIVLDKKLQRAREKARFVKQTLRVIS